MATVCDDDDTKHPVNVDSRSNTFAIAAIRSNHFLAPLALPRVRVSDGCEHCKIGIKSRLIIIIAMMVVILFSRLSVVVLTSRIAQRSYKLIGSSEMGCLNFIRGHAVDLTRLCVQGTYIM